MLKHDTLLLFSKAASFTPYTDIYCLLLINAYMAHFTFTIIHLLCNSKCRGNLPHKIDR